MITSAEQIDAEIERLEEQRNQAFVQAEDCERGLDINERRVVLALPAFTRE